MTKKDFKLIARVLNETGASNRIVRAFEDALEADNPRFKREIFHVAALTRGLCEGAH